jgi:hypothetical protein
MADVAAANLGGLSLSIAPGNSLLQLTSDHQVSDAASNYQETSSVTASLLPGLKLPVALRLTGGPGVVPSDVALAGYDSLGPPEWFIQLDGAAPLNASYPFLITYADGTTETPSQPVSFLPFAGAVSPQDGATAASDTPTFTWSAPSPAPASFVYVVRVTSADGATRLWKSAQLPSSDTSIAYDADGTGTALVAGASYLWSIEVLAADGDTSRRTSAFKAP